MKVAVAYYRVSTTRQEAAGNGIEAQKADVRAFCVVNGYQLIAEHTETQSGTWDELERRPILAKALCNARKAGVDVPVIVSKLDRLSRSVAFVSDLMRRNVPFVVAQLGLTVDDTTLHVLAAVGEREAKMIGERTAAALARLKASGKKLGCPDPAKGLAASAKARSAKADELAGYYREPIQIALSSLRGEGGKVSYRSIAAKLTAMRLAPPTGEKGVQWQPTSVRNMMLRLGVVV